MLFFAFIVSAQENPKSSTEITPSFKTDSVQVDYEKSEKSALQTGGVRLKVEPAETQYDTIRTERMIIVRPKENPAIQKESPK